MAMVAVILVTGSYKGYYDQQNKARATETLTPIEGRGHTERERERGTQGEGGRERCTQRGREKGDNRERER